MRSIRLAAAGGVLLCLAALAFGPRPAAYAQTLPVRPTLTPAAAETDDDDDQAPASGRITGTVIDLTSGAPAPGVAVRVGDATVTSDANGNYDRSGLAPGAYEVALELAAGRGVAEQGTLSVTLGAGETKVQHLAFRSPAAAPAEAPAAASLPATGGAEPSPLALYLGIALIGAAIMVRRYS